MRNQKLSFLGVLVTHTFLNLASAPKVQAGAGSPALSVSLFALEF
jgi:hypothetical protein